MKKIFYVRHGESTSNAGEISRPHAEIPLTEKGQKQALAVSELLPAPYKIITSNFLRTQQTSKPFQEKYRQQIVSYDDLNEFSALDYSLIDGLNGEQRKAIADQYWKEANHQKRTGENASTFEEFQNRVINFKPILSAFEDGTVIFGHGIWLKLLIWNMFGHYVDTPESMHAFRKFQLNFPVPNCGVFELTEFSKHKWFIQSNEKINKEIANI